MANVKYVIDADTAKAIQGMLKVVDSQAKAERQFDRTTRKVDEQKRSQETLGDRSVKSLEKVILKWGSVAGAIGAATKALNDYNQTNVAAADMAKGVRFQMGALSQLAGGNQAKFDRSIAESVKTSKQAGMPFGEALGLQFGLESFGISSQREMFADLYGTVQDVKATAEAAVTLQSAFGKGETGSIRDILNKGLAASGKTKTELDTILTAMSGGGALLKQLGASDEESFAATAVLSRITKSPEEAQTQLTAIATALMKNDMGGQGLFGGLESIEKTLAGKTEAERIAWFGRKEGNIGALNLANNMSEVMDVFREVSAGKDLVGGAVNVRRGNELMSTIEENAQSQQSLEMTRMGTRAQRELSRQNVVANELERMEASGQNKFTTWLYEQALGLAKWVDADESTLRGIAAPMDVGAASRASSAMNWGQGSVGTAIVDEIRGLREDVKVNGGRLGRPGEDR